MTKLFGVDVSDAMEEVRKDTPKYMSLLNKERVTFATRMSDLTWFDVQDNLVAAFKEETPTQDRRQHAWTYLMWVHIYGEHQVEIPVDEDYLWAVIGDNPTILFLYYTLMNPMVLEEVAGLLRETPMYDEYILFCLHHI